MRFQIEEIKNAELSQQEEEQLLAAHKRMVNAEKIAVALGEALEGVDNAVTGLSGAVSRLGDVAAVEERANDLSARLESGMIEAEDVRSTLEDMLSSLEFSEEEADRINNRIEEIRRLKRKYGGSVGAALQFLADAEKTIRRLAKRRSKEGGAAGRAAGYSGKNVRLRLPHNGGASTRGGAVVLAHKGRA